MTQKVWVTPSQSFALQKRLLLDGWNMADGSYHIQNLEKHWIILDFSNQTITFATRFNALDISPMKFEEL